jgi:hypothetical protein
MPEQIRRHAVYVSDRELVVLERAVKAYVEVIRIQTPIHAPQREANDAAHVAAVFHGHHSCACPVPPEPTG